MHEGKTVILEFNTQNVQYSENEKKIFKKAEKSHLTKWLRQPQFWLILCDSFFVPDDLHSDWAVANMGTRYLQSNKWFCE